MFTSILSAIAAIPELIKAIQELLAYFKKAEQEQWFADKTAAFQQVQNAKTDQEYIDAAKALSNLLSKS